MAYLRCGANETDKTYRETIMIHQDGGSGYRTRWFFMNKDGVLSLVNTSDKGGSTFTYGLLDGSQLTINMNFSSSYWHATLTSSVDRKIKVNLEYDGSGPTEYLLEAGVAKTIDIYLLTVYTGYNSNPLYNGGPGLIIVIDYDDSDDPIIPVGNVDGNVRYQGSLIARSALDVTNFKSIYLKSSVTLSNPGYYFVSVDGTQIYGPGTLSLDTTIDITNNTSVDLGIRGINTSSDITLNYTLS